MSWKLRKHKLKSGERVRQNPIRETAWKHDRLKVPKLGEVKIYMHRPLQGDSKSVTLVKKASLVGMLISFVNSLICQRLKQPKRLLLIWEQRII